MKASPGSWLNGGLLALSLLGLGAVALDQQGVSTTEAEARRENLLPVFRHAEISKLVLRSSDSQSALVLLRDPEDPDLSAYTLDSPGGLKADPAEASALLNSLEYATFQRLLTSPLPDESQLGLQAPRLELKLQMGRLSYRLTLGRETPGDDKAIYAAVENAEGQRSVGVVPADLLTRLDVDRRSFAGTMLLPAGRKTTRRLRVEELSEGNVTELTQSAAGLLLSTSNSLDAPQQAVLADRQLSDQLFFSLARSRAELFLDKVPEKSKARYRIEQESDSGEKVVLEILADCPGHPDLSLVHRLSPGELVACIPRGLLGNLDRSLDQLALRTLAPLRSDEIDHLLLERNDDRLDLVRKDASFLLTSPVYETLPAQTGNEFLDALLTAEGERIEAPKSKTPGSPGSSPSQTIHLTLRSNPAFSDSTVDYEFELSALGDGGLLLHRVQDDAWLQLPQSASWLFDLPATWYRNRSVLHVEEDTIESLEVLLPGSPPEQVIQRDGRMSFADSSHPDVGLLRELTHALEDLRAERWLPHVYAPTKEPRLSLTLKTLEANSPQTLTIYERVQGGHAAHLDGRPGYFVLAVPVVRQLMRSLRPRSPGRISPDAMSELRLATDGSSLLLRREGDLLVASGSGGADLGEAVAEVLRALVPLAAARPDVSLAGPDELVLSGTLQQPEGQAFEMRFGAQLDYEGQPAQLLQVSGVPYAFYVRRGQVLSLLDLL